MATVQVAALSAQGPTPVVGSTVRVAALSAVGAPVAALSAQAGPDVTTQAFRDTALNGTESVGTITLWSWAQIPNGAPTVEINGVGAARSYRAVPSPTGYTLIFELTVTDGVTNSTDRVVHTVLPWTEWVLIDSTWTAYQSMVLDTS